MSGEVGGEHMCEGQRQLSALVRIIAENPPPATEARIRLEARRDALADALQAVYAIEVPGEAYERILKLLEAAE